MRKLILLSAITAGALFSTKANAQIGVSLGVHFGNGYGPTGHVVIASPPVYTEPVIYNDYSDDDYYYLPDVDAYYDVTGNVYYYNDGNRWISAAYLPGHRDYNWRAARRYEIRENRPYLNHSYYSTRYNGNRNGWNNDARRFDNRPDMRRDDRFDNRGPQRFDNRGNNNYNRPQGNFDRGRGNNMPDNRPQGNFDRGRGNMPQQDNRPQGGFNQPQPDNRPQGGFNQPQGNRPQGGGFNQPQQNTQPGRGGNDRGNGGGFNQPQQNTQPSRGGNERGTGGGEQRFSENPAQGGMHRIARM